MLFLLFCCDTVSTSIDNIIGRIGIRDKQQLKKRNQRENGATLRRRNLS